jgi:tyrosine-protein kinase Etk/Wzc
MATATAAPTDLASFLRIIRANWLWVGICGFIGFGFGLAYALYSPRWYESTLAVIPADNDKGGGLLGAASAMMGDLPLDLPSGSSSGSERIQAVFKSRSVADAAIHKFGLMDRYQSKFIEQTRKALWHHCDSKLEKKSGVVSVTCEDKDPEVAQQLTHYLGEVANQVFRRISASSAGEERRFLEVRVGQARKDVDTASQKLREFQEQYKVIDLGEQAKAVVAEMASLKGEIMSKQMQLSYLATFTSADEATASQLKQQITLMERKLQSLDEGRPMIRGAGKPVGDKSVRPESAPSVFPVVMDVPKLRFRLEELYREQKIQETLFLLLTQQFEMAKVKEARDTSQFQIMDDAELPTAPSRPKKTMAVMLGLMLGLLVGMSWALWGRELFRSPGHGHLSS